MKLIIKQRDFQTGELRIIEISGRMKIEGANHEQALGLLFGLENYINTNRPDVRVHISG